MPDESLERLRDQARQLFGRPQLDRAGYQTETPARMRSGERHFTDRLLRQAGYITEED